MVEKLSNSFTSVATMSAAGLATAAAVFAFNQASADDFLTADIFESMHDSGYAQTLDQIPQPEILEGATYTADSFIDTNNVIDNILTAVDYEAYVASENAKFDVDLSNGHFFSLGKPGEPVVGETFTIFCAENPDYCLKSGEEPMAIDREQIPAIIASHAEFVSGTQYAEDIEQFGKEDVWGAGVYVEDLDTGKTYLNVDCEDTVLFSAQNLNSTQGVDYSSMSMLIVKTADPDAASVHAVLLVRTPDGDYLLNNDGNAMLAADAMEYYGYTPIQAQAFEDKSVWREAELKPAGVEATMDMPVEYEPVELPRPRPSRGNDIPSV